jgi:hypothetical protein
MADMTKLRDVARAKFRFYCGWMAMLVDDGSNLGSRQPEAGYAATFSNMVVRMMPPLLGISQSISDL